MKFYALGTQAVGDFGSNTLRGDFEDRPPKVQRFHLEMDRWPKDDIVEALATYAVTERLANQLKQSSLTGFSLDEVEVTTSEAFEEWRHLHAGEVVPQFYWLKVHGKPGVDDFGLISGPCELPLIVSDRAMNLLKQCNLNVCEIENYSPHKLSAAG
ncbi:MAG: hypothetical protein IT342_19615 [Candidatus Melainabacteria bacterium]|nr:hypothetical protein [Candidatus Melainabacteria bacterium]